MDASEDVEDITQTGEAQPDDRIIITEAALEAASSKDFVHFERTDIKRVADDLSFTAHSQGLSNSYNYQHCRTIHQPSKATRGKLCALSSRSAAASENLAKKGRKELKCVKSPSASNEPHGSKAFRRSEWLRAWSCHPTRTAIAPCHG
eukprot:3937945-Amphidinium_carterae.1